MAAEANAEGPPGNCRIAAEFREPSQFGATEDVMGDQIYPYPAWE